GVRRDGASGVCVHSGVRVVSVWFLTARNQGERQSRREKVKCRVFHSGQTSIARESGVRKGSSGGCEFQIGCQNELPERNPPLTPPRRGTDARAPKVSSRLGGVRGGSADKRLSENSFGNRSDERSHAAQNCVVTHRRIP